MTARGRILTFLALVGYRWPIRLGFSAIWKNSAIKRYRRCCYGILAFVCLALSNKLHIAMFPWLAFGHMIPYLELAKLIAIKGHKVSFVSTPRNIDRLPKLHPNLVPLITFVKLLLPWVDGLPANAEATSDVPYDTVQYLKKAYDGLKELITRFLETSDPDWLLYDFVPCWLPEIATRLGISNAFFSIFLGAVLSCAKAHSAIDDRKKPEDFTVPLKWVWFPTKVTFRPAEDFQSSILVVHPHNP
ncbi:hypothetical protein GH714_042333 [Hevea brasiliensis]|uniref:Uncharacterized protein n=1 Tax=Hevea brasiliensis TaxID=3981 RepID=A0A6A6K8Y3_HEVBR|nr:hypothetical protein GH714_042333 [Hevea brasiliensis]